MQPSDLGAAADELPWGGGEPVSERGFFKVGSVSPDSLPTESKSDLWERDRFKEVLWGAEPDEKRDCDCEAWGESEVGESPISPPTPRKFHIIESDPPSAEGGSNCGFRKTRTLMAQRGPAAGQQTMVWEKGGA